MGTYREVSRLTLVVTATKIERLQEISNADAEAEGIKHAGWWIASAKPDICSAVSAKEAFKKFWKYLHGPESWDANPEVVAISFDVHKCNIDQVTT
jgi:hypothetical protein